MARVTPKGAAELRLRGRAPRILIVLIIIVGAIILYATAGVLGWVPWRTSPGSTVAAGVWLVLAGVVLVLGTLRIRAAEFATSRRSAHRVRLDVPVTLTGVSGRLLDISMGGAAVQVEADALPDAGAVSLALPGTDPVPLDIVRVWKSSKTTYTASLRVRDNNWNAYRRLALWLFHTPAMPFPDTPQAFPPSQPGRRAKAAASPQPAKLQPAWHGGNGCERGRHLIERRDGWSPPPKSVGTTSARPVPVTKDGRTAG
ncbi:PilZ domain-containing protein [Arthrobacter cupressi]|uniref:PilZ domain-containing protein n=1 Tax=Arthrobacter cupressi TaxID=1045773 RepID=UPI000945747E|nr:PilZ domain-containing protein [Arthrobacter cupressi]NYD78803.1 hypothetical protein [Arthrobacter cupressi]